VNLAFKTIACQQWQVTAVVQMGMRQDNGINVFGRGGAGIPIAQAKLFVTLKQAAIDQQFLAVVLNAVFGTGDCVSTA
jgi:hypothetical protein